MLINSFSPFMVMTQLPLADNFAGQKNNMERTIIETKEYSVVETDNCSLDELVEFVVKENYIRHQKSLPENISKEIEELIKEEQQLLSTSRFFLVRDSIGVLIGCIRLHHWNHKSELPITKFGVCVAEIFPEDEYPNIWHVGRLAIKSRTNKNAIAILKTLMICAIAPIVNSHSSIMLAEIDARLIHSLRRMAIGLSPIGKPLYYIGSETVPISARQSDLINYYERYSCLLLMRYYTKSTQSPLD